MIQPKTKRCYGMKSFKYEMTKRKEDWKSLNDRLENMVATPPEKQNALEREIVSKHCYPHFTDMSGFRRSDVTIPPEGISMSINTVIPFIPIETSSTDIRKGLKSKSQLSIRNKVSHSASSSEYSEEDEPQVSAKTSKQWSDKTETQESSVRSDVWSEFVEVEKQLTTSTKKLALQHKAIRRFLERPREEVATWLKKEVKDDIEMTFEEQGVQRINKIAADFCEWVRGLGGDEQSFVSEDVLKELFQIEMDYPAARALCVNEKQKRVLSPRLAKTLEVPEISFREVLFKQLNWDAEEEKRPLKLRAFGKHLPKDLRFKPPQNKTTKTWLEWNQLSGDVSSFAEVYEPVKDLRSTQEYCRWLKKHPEHSRPKYLEDQGLFGATIPESHKSPLKETSSRLSLLSGASIRASTAWGAMQ